MAVLRIDQLDPITANTIDTDQMLLPVAGSGVVPTKQQSIQQVVNAALKNQANTLVTGDAPAFSIIARNSSDATGGDVVIQGGNGTADGSVVLQNNPSSTAAGVQNVVEVNHHGSLVSKIDSSGRVYSNAGYFHVDIPSANTNVGLSYTPSGRANTVTVGQLAGSSSTSLNTSVLVGQDAGLRINGQDNVCVGCAAGQAASSSTNVVGLIAIGRNTAQNITNASNTICIGTSAGINLGSGASNCIYMGQNSGSGTGQSNVGIGNSVLDALTSAGGCVGIGSGALGSLTTAGNTVGVGTNALGSVTTGLSNIGIGANAGANISTGSRSIAIGQNSFLNHATSTSCIAIGYNAGSTSNANIADTYNIFIGENTGSRTASTDSFNIMIGYNAGQYIGANSTNNTIIGVNAGGGVDITTTGVNNSTFIGSAAGSGITTGDNNSFYGYLAGSNITTGTNNMCLGYLSQASSATVNNEITLGNASIATLRCQQTAITGLSDSRDKTNVLDAPTTLPFIRSLRPVSFTWNIRGGSDLNGQEASGFLAQDIETALENYSGYANGWMKGLFFAPSSEQKEVAPAILLPALVKAIQEIGTSVTYYNAPSISTPSDGKISLTGNNYDAQIISINQTTNIDFYSLDQIGSRTPYYGQTVKFLNTGTSNITLNKNDVNGTVNYRLFYSQTANSLSIGRWHTFTATYLKEINNGNDGWLVETTAN